MQHIWKADGEHFYILVRVKEIKCVGGRLRSQCGSFTRVKCCNLYSTIHLLMLCWLEQPRWNQLVISLSGWMNTSMTGCIDWCIDIEANHFIPLPKPSNVQTQVHILSLHFGWRSTWIFQPGVVVLQPLMHINASGQQGRKVLRWCRRWYLQGPLLQTAQHGKRCPATCFHEAWSHLQEGAVTAGCCQW